MQTVYSPNQSIAVEGQPHGTPRKSRPYLLPWLPQITQGVIADSEAGAWVFTVVDDATGQSYSLTVTVSGAVEATTLDELVAAWQTSGKLNDLFSIAEDGADTYTLTARHANRSYTITSVPPGSMTDVITEPQAAGGAGLDLGRFVARDVANGDNAMRAVAAGDVVSDIAGFLFRTDANHFHSLENDTPDAVDAMDRGKTYAVAEQGDFWVQVEEAVTPDSTPFLILDAGGGTVGRLRASASGAQKVVTVTPVAAELDFMIEVAGVPLLSANPDGTATETEICDAFRVAAATAQADGALAGYTFGGTATLVITGPAGVDFNVFDVGEGDAAVAVTTPADVEALDVSAIVQFRSSAAANALALISVKGLV